MANKILAWEWTSLHWIQAQKSALFISLWWSTGVCLLFSVNGLLLWWKHYCTWNSIPEQFVSDEFLQTVIPHYRITPLTERGKANKIILPLWQWVNWKRMCTEEVVSASPTTEQLWSGKHEYWLTLMNQREIWFERKQWILHTSQGSVQTSGDIWQLMLLTVHHITAVSKTQKYLLILITGI